jgi:hypothetical protein
VSVAGLLCRVFWQECCRVPSVVQLSLIPALSCNVTTYNIAVATVMAHSFHIVNVFVTNVVLVVPSNLNSMYTSIKLLKRVETLPSRVPTSRATMNMSLLHTLSVKMNKMNHKTMALPLSRWDRDNAWNSKRLHEWALPRSTPNGVPWQ